ncbi:xylulokinase [Parasphingorhabdus cellanae]|uniref:Xylulose kinase n=1 Tax=Parasphingorhabdus cellanae TaxID=2806553 RepID=A0ABX7T0Y2_9SPHN|nr:xylulokinase [Parasphingorhabdus cellanae]QTD55209.1 xylulokinase [Parasphingorhabdus cellanae]
MKESLYLGIDLGTSGVKAVIVDVNDIVLADTNPPLQIQRPKPLHSEQNPDGWMIAVDEAMRRLPANLREDIGAMGLAGQMHGAVLLGEDNEILRPAILWNDGRSHDQCQTLESAVPRLAEITGNRAMPGFTAPKLLWVRENEPEIFPKIAKVLLPKDWLRFKLSRAMVSDMSDAAGTLWLDTGKRSWSEEMLQATGLTRSHMPDLAESPDQTGILSADLASRWDIAQVPIAAGGGDNAAGAVGSGVARPGDTMLSIGTSGVIFHVDDQYRPNPAGGVHTFCHALPGLWHQMSVMLSAASAVDWVAKTIGFSDTPALFAAAEQRGLLTESEIFLPYLSGERTPHNDPHATGAFFGLTHDTDPAALAQAALEGVAFAYADGAEAIAACGNEIEQLNVIGGGSRSLYWGRILASAIGKPLVYRKGADRGAAFGAARLARIMIEGMDAPGVLTAPEIVETIAPDPELTEPLAKKHQIFKDLYKDTRKG